MSTFPAYPPPWTPSGGPVDNRYLMATSPFGPVYIDDMAALGPDGYARAVRTFQNVWIVNPSGAPAPTVGK